MEQLEKDLQEQMQKHLPEQMSKVLRKRLDAGDKAIKEVKEQEVTIEEQEEALESLQEKNSDLKLKISDYKSREAAVESREKANVVTANEIRKREIEVDLTVEKAKSANAETNFDKLLELNTTIFKNTAIKKSFNRFNNTTRQGGDGTYKYDSDNENGDETITEE